MREPSAAEPLLWGAPGGGASPPGPPGGNGAGVDRTWGSNTSGSQGFGLPSLDHLDIDAPDLVGLEER